MVMRPHRQHSKREMILSRKLWHCQKNRVERASGICFYVLTCLPKCVIFVGFPAVWSFANERQIKVNFYYLTGLLRRVTQHPRLFQLPAPRPALTSALWLIFRSPSHFASIFNSQVWPYSQVQLDFRYAQPIWHRC